MTTFERKSFTNVYWDKNILSLVNKGIYSTEKLASEHIKEDDNLIYQSAVACHIQWTFVGDIKKEKDKKDEPDQSVSVSQ